MQQALDLILVIDGDGTVVDASEGAQATFGVSHHKAVGAGVLRFVLPDDRERVMAQLVALLRTPGFHLKPVATGATGRPRRSGTPSARALPSRRAVTR
jgi:PAS domain S-box-containing protein